MTIQELIDLDYATDVRKLKKLYPDAEIYGHNNFANKACPSFNARDEYKVIG